MITDWGVAKSATVMEIFVHKEQSGSFFVFPFKYDVAKNVSDLFFEH